MHNNRRPASSWPASKRSYGMRTGLGLARLVVREELTCVSSCYVTKKRAGMPTVRVGCTQRGSDITHQPPQPLERLQDITSCISTSEWVTSHIRPLRCLQIQHLPPRAHRSKSSRSDDWRKCHGTPATADTAMTAGQCDDITLRQDLRDQQHTVPFACAAPTRLQRPAARIGVAFHIRVHIVVGRVCCISKRYGRQAPHLSELSFVEG